MFMDPSCRGYKILTAVQDKALPHSLSRNLRGDAMDKEVANPLQQWVSANS
jgi:hypothetical protein